MGYREVEGDLIELAQEGHFNVIAHGCNCFCVQGAGLAPQMVNAFKTDSFELEAPCYRGDINKLGQIDFNLFFKEASGRFRDIRMLSDRNPPGPTLVVVNAYTQYNYGSNHPDGDKTPVDYEAITLCMRKIGRLFKGQEIGLPKIGAGLAGGDWERIKKIIQEELKHCNVTIINYNK